MVEDNAHLRLSRAPTLSSHKDSKSGIGGRWNERPGGGGGGGGGRQRYLDIVALPAFHETVMRLTVVPSLATDVALMAMPLLKEGMSRSGTMLLARGGSNTGPDRASPPPRVLLVGPAKLESVATFEGDVRAALYYLRDAEDMRRMRATEAEALSRASAVAVLRVLRRLQEDPCGATPARGNSAAGAGLRVAFPILRGRERRGLAACVRRALGKARGRARFRDPAKATTCARLRAWRTYRATTPCFGVSTLPKTCNAAVAGSSATTKGRRTQKR